MDGSAIAWLGHPLVAAAIVGTTMLAETVISARHERRLRSHGAVTREDFRADGVYYEANVEAARAHLFEPYLCYLEETET